MRPFQALTLAVALGVLPLLADASAVPAAAPSTAAAPAADTSVASVQLAPATSTSPPMLAPPSVDAAGSGLLARGRYLTRIGDCAACHTARGGAPFAGGRAIATPFGTIYSTNITPDPETGIGSWQQRGFRSAMHTGVAPGGRLLYPAFPFPSYSHLSPDDVDAIFAFLKTVPAVKQANREPELRFPYSLRPLLLAWRALFFTPAEGGVNASKSAEWNRGAYLVNGLGHCNACHTPRNGLGALRREQALAGALIPTQNWFAPDLRTDAGGGLEGWTADDIVDFITSGRSRRGFAFGPMAEVIRDSLQYLNDEDAKAIATYLLDQPPRADAEPARGLIVGGRRAAHLVDQGKAIYHRDCAGCHGADGQGVAKVYPPLAGNSALLGPEVNAVRAVLLGGFPPATRANPRPYSMPPFASRLSDAEVAAVVSYLRSAWGNDAPAVPPATVARYRSVSKH